MNHPTRDALAEFVAESITDPTEVQQHVATCSACQHLVAEISAVPDVLSNAAPPPMPADVAARLQAVIASEVQRRNTGEEQAELEAESAAAAARTALGTFGANLPGLSNPDLGNKVIGPRSKRLTNR